MSTTTPNTVAGQPHLAAGRAASPGSRSRLGRRQHQLRADIEQRIYLMGGPDDGVRQDVMGESDTSFVDWLFTGVTAP
jgi:hypothetical protein